MIAGSDQKGLIDPWMIEVVSHGSDQRRHYFQVTQVSFYLRKKSFLFTLFHFIHENNSLKFNDYFKTKKKFFFDQKKRKKLISFLLPSLLAGSSASLASHPSHVYCYGMDLYCDNLLLLNLIQKKENLEKKNFTYLFFIN